MAGIADRAQLIVNLYYILCHLVIMKDAGYITKEETESLRPIVLAALRTALGF